ncbi:hypothetical protein Tco_1060447, partial [Tanacetum coccineum]
KSSSSLDLLLVPVDYPDLKSSIQAAIEPWKKLYGDMLTIFDLSLRKIDGHISLGDMARDWDASARFVITEFVE